MAKKTSLKSVLITQQARLRKNAKAKEASEKAQKQLTAKGKPNKGKSREIEHVTSSSASGLREDGQTQATIPFKATDRILLVGEGDFSFTRALLRHPTLREVISPQNITATAYDSEEECFSKYSEARSIVQELKERGTEILFGVDATALEKCKVLRKRKWDRIVWNFPHAGKGITDQSRNILSNQTLLLGFLRSAAPLLATGPTPKLHSLSKKKRRRSGVDEGDDEDDTGNSVSANNQAIISDDDEEFDQAVLGDDVSARGTILITLRNVPPYTEWDIPRLAKKPPAVLTSNTPRGHNQPHYTLFRSFRFVRSAWPGYSHRMTKGQRRAAGGAEGTTGRGGEDRTWEFFLEED